MGVLAKTVCNRRKYNPQLLKSTKASTFVPWPFVFSSWEEGMRIAWEPYESWWLEENNL